MMGTVGLGSLGASTWIGQSGKTLLLRYRLGGARDPVLFPSIRSRLQYPMRRIESNNINTASVLGYVKSARPIGRGSGASLLM